jgi:branched-chain amino acid transport system permease protein
MIQDHLFFTGINILLAWSVYIILLSGSLSFANGAFMAIGAYSAGVLSVKFAWPMALALAAAALATGVLGALIATPALRTRGVYLILLTTGVTFCVQVLLENFDYIGGVGGLGGMSGATVWHVYGAVVLVGVLLWWLSRSHLQRMLDAVREDEQVAAALGINTVYLKVVCFALGAALAALAGGLYSHYMSFIRPENFGVLVSVYVVLYVVFGGVNNLWGALLGAVVLTLLPELIRGLASWRPLVFGLLIVILLLVRPEGLLPWRSATGRPAPAKALGRSTAFSISTRSPDSDLKPGKSTRCPM